VNGPTAADTTCALCGKPNYHHCPCPWHLPFDKWPKQLRVRLVDRIPHEPSEGS
jgi:hypothetical protein